MRSKDSEANANEHSQPKSQGDYPAYDWGNLVRGTFRELYDSWLQNLVIGIALLLLSPLVVFLFMKSIRGMLFGFGAGITIVFWIVLLLVIKQVTAPENDEPLLTPGTGETPKIENSAISEEVINSVPEQLRETFKRDALAWKPPPIPESAFVIFLGNSVSWTHSFPHTVLMDHGHEVIQIGKNIDNLWVTGTFFGENGRLICEIIKNRIHPNQNYYSNVLRVEYPSPHTLLVINDRGQTSLDLQYINKRCVRILGDFYTHAGTHIVITPEWQSLGGGRMSGNISGDNGGASYNIQ